MLAEKAKKYRMYVVAQIPERDGAKRYSTGVLIDRDGNLVGKY
ncbi:aliphatic nitrilase, partial [Candidatus Bathyarchaeota archaeon]